MKDYFKLYSYCIPVMGASGAIIVNLKASSYTTIPQFLCEILQDYDNCSIQTLEDVYQDNNQNIRQYFARLSQADVGFYTDTPEQYPKIDLSWDTPETIKYAVLKIEEYHRFDYGKLLSQLDSLLCKNIEIWFTGAYTKDNINDLLASTKGSVLRSVTLILPFREDISIADYGALVSANEKIGQIYLYQAPEEAGWPDERIFSTTKNLADFEQTFKNIPANEYIIMLEFFTESIKHNPYYNRKICIDENGFIKNCLTHHKHYGNIRQVDLSEVAADPAFRELWYACNDRVLEIKDSAFRYIWMNTHELEKVDEHYYRIIAS